MITNNWYNDILVPSLFLITTYRLMENSWERHFNPQGGFHIEGQWKVNGKVKVGLRAAANR